MLHVTCFIIFFLVLINKFVIIYNQPLNKMFLKQTLLFFWEVAKIVFLALVIVIPIRYFIFQPFIVKGISMEPNFSDSDYLIVDEITYRFRAPERGDVIIFRYPQNLSEKFIKRVIGLPGEIISLEGNQIFVVDRLGQKKVLDESEYLNNQTLFNQTDFLLSEDEFFVLGDNRQNSFDSRSWGVLPKKNIIGRALFRVFPPATAAAYFTAPEY